MEKHDELIRVRLLKLREIKKIKQKDLAEMIGMHPSNLALIEKGKRPAPNATIIKISKLMDIPVQYFFDEDFPVDSVLVEDATNNDFGNKKEISTINIDIQKLLKATTDLLEQHNVLITTNNVLANSNNNLSSTNNILATTNNNLVIALTEMKRGY